MPETPPATVTPPPEAFARLFESVHEGVYIGTLSPSAALTLSANPYLKLMFGYAAETPQDDVRPFELERFVDPQAREGFVERRCSVMDHLPTTCCGCGERTGRRCGWR